jgi:8-oxoguanine deaminase
MKTVLKNLSYIATFDTDDTEMQDADIVIDGRRIDRIGSDLPTRDADRVIDGRGLLATPGLINAHQHLYQASLRTIPQLERSGMPAFLMAQNTIGLDRWRAGRLGAAEQRVIARAALIESVLGGITTVADQHLFFPGREPEPTSRRPSPPRVRSVCACTPAAARSRFPVRRVGWCRTSRRSRSRRSSRIVAN